MKKSLLCITIILICLFSGCSSEKSERSATSLTNAAQNTITASALQANKTDDTALIENTFSMDGRKTIQTMSGEADGEVFRNLEALYQRASNIVAGTVEAIEYTDDGAIPRTIYHFSVSESLKGDIAANSLISISESNGYVRMKTFIDTYGNTHFEDLTEEDIENGTILMTLSGAPLPKEGEEYVICLGQKKTEGRIAGAYAVIGNFMGKYVLDKNSELYSRYCPEGQETLYKLNADTKSGDTEQPMSLNEIKSKILSFSNQES